MKQEQDKEIDLLLKRHARNENARLKSAFFGEEGNLDKAFDFDQSPHLDADEMNAYAENALSAPTRARYATHLIDCNDCRTLVTQLALSANPNFFETKSETVATTAVKQTWGQWFSSLLKFPTLRVAGPVVAVLCVAVIGMIVLQSKLLLNKESLNQSAERDAMPIEAAQRGSNEPESTTLARSTSQDSSNTSGKLEEMTRGKKGADLRENNAPSVAAKEQEKQQPEDATTLSKTGSTMKDADVDSAPKPAAPSQPQTKLEPANKQRLEYPPGNKTDEEVRAQADGTNESNRSRDIAERNVQRPSANASTGASGAGLRGPAKSKSADNEKTADERKDEAKNDDLALKRPAPIMAKRAAPATRSVSGKQFRREGAGWVDVSYDYSMATTNISRGSGKYESLISDEPGLRNIVEQLGGEVVIVWKGRAYRFR